MIDKDYLFTFLLFFFHFYLLVFAFRVCVGEGAGVGCVCVCGNFISSIFIKSIDQSTFLVCYVIRFGCLPFCIVQCVCVCTSIILMVVYVHESSCFLLCLVFISYLITATHICSLAAFLFRLLDFLSCSSILKIQSNSVQKNL